MTITLAKGIAHSFIAEHEDDRLTVLTVYTDGTGKIETTVGDITTTSKITWWNFSGTDLYVEGENDFEMVYIDAKNW